MRLVVLACLVLSACAKAEPVVQDPLDYLRVGVDPRAEADALTEGLQREGFEIVQRIDEANYVAFDAIRGADSLVRVVSTRGVVLSVQAPDARWPERLWLQLASGRRPDFDGDGRGDVVVAIRERDRICLAWAEVDVSGFASEVFRPLAEWGDAPCVVEIDPAWPRLLLEVTVPDSATRDARVRVPVRAEGSGWVLDDSRAAVARWDEETARRQKALEDARTREDRITVDRLTAELDWLDHLRNAQMPVLEPADDGEEAR